MTTEPLYESIFLARQPIFDLGMNTWGNALLFRDKLEADTAEFADGFEASMRVVANMVLFDEVHCCGTAMVMVHFPPAALVEQIPFVLPQNCTVVLTEESSDPRILLGMEEMHEREYQLAIDNFTGSRDYRQCYKLADILVVDVLGKTRSELRRLALEASKYDAQLLAKRVEDIDTLDELKGLGFRLFQGFFFRKPKTLSGRTISSSQVSRLKLFEVLEHEEPDYDLLTQSIEADVSISYRLLTYLNSSYFSFSQKITSIRQAVVLTGWGPIRRWLRMVLMTDLLPNEKTMELVILSAQRAKFFETMALMAGYKDLADSLFLLGLFSLLEAVFDKPMKTIVTHLPLDDELANALCGKKNAYARWLHLAKAIEDSDWLTVGELAHELRLPTGSVAESYRESYNWVDNFFGMISPVCPAK